jgi:DNA (cytosine-5)-methyltransferase 1
MQSICAQASTSATPATHRVIELFAGVGGFHFGLEQANQQRQAQGLPRAFDVVYASQWEPKGKHQHAARVYEAQFGLAPVCRDLMEVLDDSTEMARIHALAPTMLVGGFPCQDYSVAKPSSKSEGIEGKKGVLWWGIHRMLQACIAAGQPVQQVLLENVDRLISSPSACPGRDFAIILASLQSLGYGVSWQVINAGDYGFAQRRKRVFIVAVHQSTPQFQQLEQATTGDLARLLVEATPLAQALPVHMAHAVTSFELGGDVYAAQVGYQAAAGGKTQFSNAGVCVGGRVFTGKVRAVAVPDCTAFTGCPSALTLGDVVAQTQDVPESFYIPEAAIGQWEYAKGAKCVPRVSATGFAYDFKEGAMPFPDALDKPSRTIITSEGGTSASRTKHAVRAADGRLRRLTPEELEELNGFPRGFTRLEGVNAIARARLMGNALITGLVARIGAAMADSAPTLATPSAMRHIPTCPTLTDAQRTTIHSVGWTLLCGSGGETAEWKTSIGLSGDLTCSIFGCPLKVGLSHRSRMVLVKFRCMADMRDNIEAALSKKRLPKAVRAKLTAEVPTFLIDAESAYQTGQYFSRPRDGT